MDEEQEYVSPFAAFRDRYDPDGDGGAQSTPARAESRPREPGVIGKLGRSILRGVARGVNEMASAAAQFGARSGLVNERTFNEQKALAELQGRMHASGYDTFEEWYANGARVSPIPERFIPESQGGIYGMVEGISQFAVGYGVAGRSLRLLGAATKLSTARAFTSTTRLAKAGRATGVGALADMLAFDPREDRLSNFAQSLGGPFDNALTRYLAADDEDPILLGRVKQSLEGVLMSGAVEGVTYLARSARIGQRLKRGEITQEAAERELDEATEQFIESAQAADESEFLEIVPGENGTATLRLREELPEEAREVLGDLGESPETVTFSSIEEAETTAAIVTYLARKASQPVMQLDEATERAILDNILDPETRDLRAALGNPALGGGLYLNLDYTNPAAIRNFIFGVEAAVQNRLRSVANRSAEGLGVTNLETAEHARDWVRTLERDDLFGEIASEAARMEGAPARLIAYRALDLALAGETNHAANLLAKFPNNEAAAVAYKMARDAFLGFHERLVELKANIGRTLQSNQMELRLTDLDRVVFRQDGSQRIIRLPRDGAAGGVDNAVATTVPEAATEVASEIDEAGKALEELLERAARDPEEFTHGTEGVNAEDFIRSREYRRAEAALARAEALNRELERGPVPPEVLAAARKARSERILRESENAHLASEAAEIEGSRKGPARGRNAIEDISKRLEAERAFLDQITDPRPRQLPEPKLDAEITRFNLLAEVKGRRLRRYPVPKVTRAELLSEARGLTITRDPDALFKAMRRSVALERLVHEGKIPQATALDLAQSFRMNMMLSGPKTQIVNFVTSFINGYWRAGETALSGVLTGDRELAKFGAQWFAKMTNIDTFMDSSRAFWRVMRSGQTVLDGRFIIDDTGSITAGADAVANAQSAFTRLFHQVTSFTSRFMISTDEFTKTLTYRANIHAQGLRKAREIGLTNPEDIGEFLADFTERQFDELGGGTNVPALQRAREATFQSELQDGTFGKSIQEIAQKHFAMRFILPFVRTPVNLIHWTWDRTPALAALRKANREMWAAGGDQRARVIAQQFTGFMIFGSVMALADSGMITGNGPSHPDLRRQWLEAGNQPYSLRLGDRQISFNRADPFAMPFRLMADAFELWDEIQDQDRTDLGMAIISTLAAMASTAAGATYLRGLSEFFDAVSSGSYEGMEWWLASAATSYTPNLLNQMKTDPHYRETQGIVDSMKSRVPWLSSTLEPRMNIFGEPVMREPGYINQALNPWTYRNAPDPTLDELNSLGKPIGLPRTTRPGNIDLTDRKAWDNGTGKSPYYRMMEIVRENGLRSQVEGIMRDPSWESMGSGTGVFPGGLRFEVVNNLVQAAFNAAEAQMLSEYPKLQDALIQHRHDSTNALFNIQ